MTAYSSNYQALNEEEDEDLFAYNYGADFPEALTQMGSEMLGGRPTNKTLGPVQQMKILVTAAEFRAATPRRPGKGKPLPASSFEGEQEQTSRKTAQKACQRLIIPKPKSESSDAFIRRLDAHRNAPEALIVPLTPPEDEALFAKRMMAVKATEGTPNVLILPKSSRENVQEFEERLAAVKKAQTIIFPRGAHETNAHWKARLAVAVKSRRPLLPKSEEESESGFKERVDLQLLCERVVHPYDPSRESDQLYVRRLKANKQRTAWGFEPGDTKAIDGVLGAHVAPKARPQAEAEAPTAAADLMAAAMEKEEKLKAKESAAAAALEAKLKAEEAEKAEAENEEARVAERIAQMKLKQEEERKKKEEEEANKGFGLEKIAINKIGFMPLKKLLMERGVPKEQVFACANKFALMEVAKKWATELKIEWTDDSVDIS